MVNNFEYFLKYPSQYKDEKAPTTFKFQTNINTMWKLFYICEPLYQQFKIILLCIVPLFPPGSYQISQNTEITTCQKSGRDTE